MPTPFEWAFRDFLAAKVNAENTAEKPKHYNKTTASAVTNRMRSTEKLALVLALRSYGEDHIPPGPTELTEGLQEAGFTKEQVRVVQQHLNACQFDLLDGLPPEKRLRIKEQLTPSSNVATAKTITGLLLKVCLYFATTHYHFDVNLPRQKKGTMSGIASDADQMGLSMDSSTILRILRAESD